ncbi:uncharacterized protein GGS22DRAFT_173951 [Annulohypoxylon maeteangense]|uniref:uncharacterized protein n=1 Tax=Annulohypoxylon maeteangense TaxID=1927788 RepID=UPI002007A70D|nr:uncharacterized protein GGS22DRAFT_173951 [Annulohypoxylon maeteangense]KAI0880988.1 hypothetical protein GGS22DRAFT_173951 [Annulohypoxylon maeteangense]
MAHLAPSSQAAIFSPSVARAAASTAKDWSYVDSWLRNKYASSSTNRGRPPSFERNPETLKVLLALAAANEAADEDREQLARLEEAALAEVEASERELEVRRQKSDQHPSDTIDGELFAADLLEAIESNLGREGTVALDAMSNMAVDLGVAYPTPEMLGAKYVELQGRALELEDSLERVNLLQRYLDHEAAQTDSFLEELRRGNAYQPAPDLAKQNLELQRKIKNITGKLPELKQQVVALEKSVGLPSLTVENVKGDEGAYLELLARKKDLDVQVKAFAGLPPDIEAARMELEALRAELRDVTDQRDTNFEKLVERESPVKTRRRL